MELLACKSNYQNHLFKMTKEQLWNLRSKCITEGRNLQHAKKYFSLEFGLKKIGECQ